MSFDVQWRPTEGEILTVSELVGKARTLAETLFCDIWIEGEILDLKIPYSGHAYFAVGDESARLRAVCFKNTLRLLDHPPRDGLTALMRGRLSVYEPRGDLQFIVEYMSPVGEGLNRLKLEALMKKLRAEGLFDEARKRPLPAMSRAVAVVTSSSGAAVRDVLKVLKRRAPWLDVYICPTLVQGEGAAAGIIRAIEIANAYGGADLVIVGRGGGSGEDLSAFNDEGVVRAVAASRLPVISAVGHETDYTLTDFAADQRAPTPSAAAEIAVRESSHWVGLLKKSEISMAARLGETIYHLRGRLSRLDPRAYDPQRVIERRRLRVDRLMEEATHSLRSRFSSLKEKLTRADQSLSRNSPDSRLQRAFSSLEANKTRLDFALSNLLAAKRASASLLSSTLENLSPEAVLERGYAVVTDSRGKVLTSSRACELGDDISVRLQKGALGCEIIKIYK